MTFDGGITADVTPEGTLEYTFPEPRPVSEIDVQTKDDKPVEVVFELEDGTVTTPTPLETSPDEPVKNDITPDQPGVVKVIIKTPDDTPLTPEDIISVEVIACKEGQLV